MNTQVCVGAEQMFARFGWEIGPDPIRCVHRFDFGCRDDAGTATESIDARLGAIVRPFKRHDAGGIELLQQMLDEGTDGIDAAILRMQPDTVSVPFNIKAPFFQKIFQRFRKRFWNGFDIAQLDGLLVQIKSISFLGIIFQKQHQTKICEIIGHEFPFGLRVSDRGDCARRDRLERPRRRPESRRDKARYNRGQQLQPGQACPSRLPGLNSAWASFG